MPSWLDTAAALCWRGLAVAATVAVVLFAVSKLFLVVLPVVVALLLATLLAPPAAWLSRHRWPPALAAAVVVVGSIASVVAVLALLAPLVAGQLRGVGDNVAEGGEEALQWLIEGPLELSPEEIDEATAQGIAQARENVGAITSGVLTGAAVAAEVLIGVLLTLVLLFFFVKDGRLISGWALERAPAHRRGDLVAVGSRAWDTLAGYVRGLAVVAMVDALGIGLGLALIGVPLVLPLMAFTFVGGFFPIIGATVVGMVAVLVALVSGGPLDALLTVGVVIAVQQLEGNLLQPIVMGRAVRLHPVVVLLAITTGAVLAGVVGAFLAVPATAVAAAVGNELRLRAVTAAGDPALDPPGS